MRNNVARPIITPSSIRYTENQNTQKSIINLNPIQNPNSNPNTNTPSNPNTGNTYTPTSDMYKNQYRLPNVTIINGTNANIISSQYLNNITATNQKNLDDMEK